jgi:hypothetical protein
LAAAPQDLVDREAYARDYVRFLVVQLDQWSGEFPRDFNAALLRPPIDASKMSETAKSGPSELGGSFRRLSSLAAAKDVLTNAQFRGELQHALAVSKELNQAMGAQRFPALLQSSWDQIRSTLNSLARAYQLETLAFLEPPGGGGGRGGPAATAKGALPPGALSGYIVDVSCAKRGKGMWANAECVARCVRDGDKVVLVTEDGKIFQIANQEKIAPESYGQMVTLTGKTAGDTITIETLKL